MNAHRLLDQLIGALGRVAMPRHFRDGTGASSTLDEHFAAVALKAPEATASPEFVAVPAATLAGPQLAGFRMVRWVGPDAGTVIHCHGGGELPFDKSASKIFARDKAFPGNVVVIQSPLHASRKEFTAGIATMDPWLAMLAVSVELVEQLVRQLTPLGPVVVSGYSLGGFIANLHFLRHASADVYAPMAAGLDMGNVVLDSARKNSITAAAAEDIKNALNFQGELGPAVGSRLFPVLGRYDYINPPERHADAYGHRAVAIWPRGHFTGVLSSGPLWRAHLQECLQTAALVRAKG